MFPETFVERWLKKLTEEGDLVVDPFSGRGTTAFQAILMGRKAVATDVSPVAYVVSSAKTGAPTRDALRARIRRLEEAFDPDPLEPQRLRMPEFFRVAYRPATLRQILYLRQSLLWRTSRTDRMIAALALGSLHGESESSATYLSAQMPHTIATKPAYSVRYWKERKLKAPRRDVFELLRDRVSYRYATGVPEGDAAVHLSDMRRLPGLIRDGKDDVRCVVTSPPYWDITNFEEDQWLRNWFLGGPPHPTNSTLTADNRHRRADRYWGLIADMWRVLGRVAGKGAHIVIRLGAKRISVEKMVELLDASTKFSQRKVRLIECEVSDIRNRQTRVFSKSATGCLQEVDCCFRAA